MKISFYTPGGQVLTPIENEFRNQGIEILTNDCDKDCDFIFLSTVTSTNQAYEAVKKYPNIPLVVYNWDQYGWHKTQGYNWDLFNNLQEKCIEIWVPSQAVTDRIKEYISNTNKCHIVKSYARLFEYNGEIKDNRYIYQPMRNYELDKNYGWLRKACSELNIPLIETHHKLNEIEFQKMIAECSFLVCEYHEASTGGLTLIEGYRLGKPVLVSDSKYMGARDYFGEKAIYFNDTNYDNFKSNIESIWNNPPVLDKNDCINFTNQYTVNVMVTKMISRLHELKL